MTSRCCSPSASTENDSEQRIADSLQFFVSRIRSKLIKKLLLYFLPQGGVENGSELQIRSTVPWERNELQRQDELLFATNCSLFTVSCKLIP
jgi:hypothetical protein